MRRRVPSSAGRAQPPTLPSIVHSTGCPGGRHGHPAGTGAGAMESPPRNIGPRERGWNCRHSNIGVRALGSCREFRPRPQTPPYTNFLNSCSLKMGRSRGKGLAGSAFTRREGLRHAIGHAKGACSKDSSGCNSIYRSSPIVLPDPLAKGFVDASLPPASSQLEIVDYVRRNADGGRHFRPCNGRPTATDRSLGELLRPAVSGQIRRVVPAQALVVRVLVLVHLLASRR